MPATTTTTMSSAAMSRYGAILPRKTSRGRKGITASCSIVPLCRSRTTPRAVATVPTNTRMMPQRPGIMITASAGRGCRARTPARRAAPPAASARRPLLAFAACNSARLRSAAWAAKSSVPSMSTVVLPPAAVTTATTAEPRRSSSCARPGRRRRPLPPRRRRRGGSRRRPGARADEDGGHVLDVETRGVPEHDQEEEGKQEQHGQRAPVPAQFSELFDGDGAHEWSSLPHDARGRPAVQRTVDFITR